MRQWEARQATPSAIGYVRGFDVKTGKRLWIFHTIPKKGEFGYDTWLDGSAERNGNLGAWAQMSADMELGLVYVPTGNAGERLLWRQPARQPSVFGKPGGSGPEDRQAKVALSDDSSRTVGHRSAVRADPL